jgi:hypothetical protein
MKFLVIKMIGIPILAPWFRSQRDCAVLPRNVAVDFRLEIFFSARRSRVDENR